MQKLEWGAYQNDHEDANGQFEMNWNFVIQKQSDVLQTADRHAFFKFMVKSIAEKHSLRATFMPKPFADLTGNGCHSHISFWNKGGSKNLFEDKKNKLSKTFAIEKFSILLLKSLIIIHIISLKLSLKVGRSFECNSAI